MIEQCWMCDNADIDKYGCHCMILWPQPEIKNGECTGFSKKYDEENPDGLMVNNMKIKTL